MNLVARSSPVHRREDVTENFIREHQNPNPPDKSNDEFNQGNQALPAANEQSQSSSQDAKIAMPTGGARKGINQGDIYWVAL